MAFCILLFGLVKGDTHTCPKRSCDEQSRVQTCKQAEDDRHAELANGVAAENCKEDDGDHRRAGGVHRTSDGRANRLIAYALIVDVLLTFERFDHFTATVEDDDGVVDRVCNDRDHRSNVRAVDLNSANDRERKHDDNVVNESDDCSARTRERKSDHDVHKDESKRNRERDACLGEQVACRRCADRLKRDVV